ncbi:MAG: hypothetical protein ABIJ17_02450 [Patescibacteria group bacterium]
MLIQFSGNGQRIFLNLMSGEACLEQNLPGRWRLSRSELSGEGILLDDSFIPLCGIRNDRAKAPIYFSKFPNEINNQTNFQGWIPLIPHNKDNLEDSGCFYMMKFKDFFDFKIAKVFYYNFNILNSIKYFLKHIKEDEKAEDNEGKYYIEKKLSFSYPLKMVSTVTESVRQR